MLILFLGSQLRESTNWLRVGGAALASSVLLSRASALPMAGLITEVRAQPLQPEGKKAPHFFGAGFLATDLVLVAVAPA